MVFGFLRSKLVGCDQTGITPSLYYRRESSYGTAIGGFCSIIATILVLFFVTSEMYGLIVAPSYNQNIEYQYVPADEQQMYNIDNVQGTLAVSLLDFHDDEEKQNLTRYVRPVIFTANSVDDGKLWTNVTLYEAVPCEEVFKDKPSALKEFETYGQWWCPDIEQYTLAGQSGFTLFMTIQRCPSASRKLGFDISECEQDEEVIYDYLDGKVQANTKYVGQYFNIDNYLDDHDQDKMHYIGYQERNTMLFRRLSRLQTYKVQMNHVSIYT